METFSYISSVLLGIALGVGGDWLFWQLRLKKANERVREESRAVGQAFNAQIEEKEQRLADMTAEHEAAVKALRADLAAAGEEAARLKEQLHEEERKLAEARALTQRLPDLEKLSDDQEAAIKRLTEERQAALALLDQERQAAAAEVARLEALVAEERKAFENATVYVQGGHYLPASVIRNLTRGSSRTAESDGVQD